MTLTAATITERYKANYDRIAREHVAYARAHGGGNPFMEPALVETLEAATEEIVRRYVTPGSAILDAGCGPGTLLQRIGRLPGYTRFGVDLSDDYIEYARSLPGNEPCRIFWADLDRPSMIERESFDAVICADVLEHVLDEHAVLQGLTRVLKPGGHLIIRVPQEDDLSIYPNGGYDYVHLRKFDHPTLRLLLEDIHGFRVIHTDTVDYPGWTEIHAVAVKP